MGIILGVMLVLADLFLTTSPAVNVSNHSACDGGGVVGSCWVLQDVAFSWEAQCYLVTLFCVVFVLASVADLADVRIHLDALCRAALSNVDGVFRQCYATPLLIMVCECSIVYVSTEYGLL